jgi:uncharacterized membrane protein
MKELKKQNPELMNNDPAKWYGPFYFNKKDSRIIVPKLNPSLGGTFNMASPYAILIFIVIIASIVITAVFSI